MVPTVADDFQPLRGFGSGIFTILPGPWVTCENGGKLVRGIMMRTHPSRFRVPAILGYCVRVFEEIDIEYR